MDARRSAFIATLGLALTLSGCRSTPPPNDTALNTAVQGKLTADTAIADEPIQTFVQDGVVTLQGSVSSEAARALAASDVSQVSGIRNVVNQLTIQARQANQASLRASNQPAPHAATSAPAAPAPARKPSPSQQRRQPPPLPTPVAHYDPPPPPQPAPIERHAPTPSTQEAPPQPPSAPSFRNVTVPSGTTLPIRITQTLDSATARQGDAFSGSLASDVVIDGLVAIPAGTTVNGRLDEVHEAAHFKGSALLTLSLVSLNRRGDRTPLTTEPYTEEGKGRGKNTAEKVGGGAAVGAILGGIFGGGKGAAIGAAAGGGLGAGANGVSRGQQVQIPSETLIRFHLTTPITVRASTATSQEGDTNLQRHPGN